MKQSCYFVKVCDRKFNKKHIGVIYFIVTLYRLTNLRERETKDVSICWGLLLEDSRAIGISFDTSRKLLILKQIRKSHVFFNFSLNIYAEFHNR